MMSLKDLKNIYKIKNIWECYKIKLILKEDAFLMKRVMIKDVLFGVLIIIVITFLEFIVTIPIGEPLEEADTKTWASIINRELLLTALPVFFTTFFFTWKLNTKSKSDAVRRGVIWTVIITLYYMIIGLGNNNFQLIFGKIGIYILIACSFAGPVFYIKIKKLN